VTSATQVCASAKLDTGSRTLRTAGVSFKLLNRHSNSNDSDGVRISLIEDCTETLNSLGKGERSFFGKDLLVLVDHLVGNLFHLLHLCRSHRALVGEVETEPLRSNKTASLVSSIFQNSSKGKVQNVSSSVVAHHLISSLFVYIAFNFVPNSKGAFNRTHVKNIAAANLDIGRPHLVLALDDEPFIEDLTTLLGVEGSSIQKKATLLPGGHAVHELFVVTDCQDLAGRGGKLVTSTLTFTLGNVFILGAVVSWSKPTRFQIIESVDIKRKGVFSTTCFSRTGELSGRLALLVPLIVHLQPLLLRHQLSEVDRKAISVV